VIRKLLLALVVLVSSLTYAATEAADTALPNPQVIIKTMQGDITLRLFRDKAPITVANFLTYVDSGHYNGTIFHRVIPGYMIQGGGFTPDMVEKEVGDSIVNEARNRLHNIRGSIAMARTNDPDSATAQFFINHRTNLQLDWTPTSAGYTVFGEVISGMEVVDFLSSAPVTKVGQHSDVPVDPIIIETIERKSLL
jgi:cyclophilin family peptidyl-prolyl cis-trans isomerase